MWQGRPRLWFRGRHSCGSVEETAEVPLKTQPGAAAPHGRLLRIRLGGDVFGRDRAILALDDLGDELFLGELQGGGAAAGDRVQLLRLALVGLLPRRGFGGGGAGGFGGGHGHSISESARAHYVSWPRGPLKTVELRL